MKRDPVHSVEVAKAAVAAAERSVIAAALNFHWGHSSGAHVRSPKALEVGLSRMGLAAKRLGHAHAYLARAKYRLEISRGRP